MLLDLGRPELLGSEAAGVREELLDVQALVIVCVGLALRLLGSSLSIILPSSSYVISGSTPARTANQATALLL